MHFSLFKTAIAFLSLGTTFLGANSAPTNSSKELIVRVPRIPVPDPTQYGYTLNNLRTPTSDMGDKWEVWKGETLCDVLGVNPGSQMMAVA
jgi:hypothetical protein